MWMKIVVVLIVSVVTVRCVPTGAPAAACATMSPSHPPNSAQENTASPYAVMVSTTNVTAGGVVTVTLTSSTNTQFRGILLEARATPSGDAIGSWAVPDANYQNLECNGYPTSALTHTSRVDKNSGATFEWTSPSMDPPSSVYIFASVVQVYDTYYVMMPSEVVAISGAEEGSAGGNTGNNIQTTTPGSASTAKLSFFALVGAILFHRMMAVFYK